MTAEGLLIARGKIDAHLLPRMANRHGLIAGATGTGKTVTLQKMAEEFSRLGVPVFLADVKGDLTGLALPGSDANAKVAERRKQLEVDDQPFRGCPLALWDVFGEQGTPLRATISQMGPILMARILELNDTQAAVLTLTFRVADEIGLLLLDLKDLQSMVRYVGENAKELSIQYGNVAPATIAAIQRALLHLEEQGGDKLFGEPALTPADMMRTDVQGQGVINILAADKLLNAPKVYATLLLWMLSELFERLPEVGDAEKPKLVYFFDEAHLLFNDAPPSLLDKIEQVVRLIRSKGVGVYFATQNPIDVPDKVLGQLGNRVQHALRAFSARDKKAVKAAAETFRENPELDVAKAITELEIGEALVSFLDKKGMPGIVTRDFIVPPTSQIGPITAEQRKSVIDNSPLHLKYAAAVDRESAYELLKKRAEMMAEEKAKAGPQPKGRAAKPQDDFVTSVVKSAATSALRSGASQLGRSLTRGILGSLFGK
ncbi:MAG: helicase HerA-like domain-containing protein [Isosphaeraceae bacterium]